MFNKGRKMGDQYALGEASRVIGLGDLALAIKTAVHYYIEKVEEYQEEKKLNDQLFFSSRNPYAEALEPLMSSLYWGYNGNYFQYSEAEFEKIQSIIAEYGDELQFAIRVALTEWKTDFEKRRTDRNLPHYTPAYIREQIDKFNLRRELGIPVDHEGMEFALSLANLHALNWILDLEFTFPKKDQKRNKNLQIKVENQELHGMVMGNMSEDVFLIIEAIREAGRSYIKHAPKDEEQQHHQERKLQDNQNIIWYDPDFTEPLKRFVYSRETFGKWFKLLESDEVQPELCLHDVRLTIDQQGIKREVLYALGCWEDEFIEDRNQKGKPEYSPAYVREQQEKFAIQKETGIPADAEGVAYQRYVAVLQARRWLNKTVKPSDSTWQLRSTMQAIHGISCDFQGSWNTMFTINTEGKVPLMDIAGEWIDAIEDENRENFLNRKSSNIVLHAEKDVVAWVSDRHRSPNRYDPAKLSKERLSLLAKVITEALIMTRYDQLNENDKAITLSSPDSNMLFRSRKRIIAMYEGMLNPDGFRLTGLDIEVLQEAISLEIEAARQRQQQTVPPVEDQEAKTPQTPKKDGRIKVEDREAYKRKMFPQMIELLCNGVTKTSASEIVAAPFGIKPNTVEIKFNKFMKSKKDAINLLKEIGRDDLIEKLNELNA